MPKLSKTKKKSVGVAEGKQSTAPSASPYALHTKPLGQSIEDDVRRSRYVSGGRRRGGCGDENDSESDAEILDEATTRRILSVGKQQREELARQKEAPSSVLARGRVGMVDSSDEEERTDGSDDDGDADEYDDVVVHDQGSGYVTVSGPGLTEEEEDIVRNMISETAAGPRRKTLGELIEEKIKEKEEGGGGQPDHAEFDIRIGLPPKVVEVYTDIGRILGRYTAGKLPKAFKVIPSLSNWEEVLYLTRPDGWSPQAMYAATRIFASNLNPKMAQRFYNLVLLDAVRADVHANKKLNYHYYAALKKALYKPAAFFKGILLPLCAAGDCSLREAAVIASVLRKASIPVHHSAVAIHKLSQMDYSGATSVFLRTLLDKKYSLPAPAVRSVVRHFGSFVGNPRELPVLWHQCLLVFVQRYKNELGGEEDRAVMKEVLKEHFHPKITPEVRRELFGYKQERGGNALVEDAHMAI
eukprot:CAMPEP_0194291324 /NCGR_PEP_ID=MMETSP0169-20130528/43194_1 /TAXON_ID=218684 /ORGANISM="Corethron pennatum, Strain L29A3" /LENGTH=469 /DNA_ID=CAMNT_0039039173 /DNA_START=130 /DNA_END=1539 /DNA_ORIENTATION=+